MFRNLSVPHNYQITKYMPEKIHPKRGQKVKKIIIGGLVVIINSALIFVGARAARNSDEKSNVQETDLPGIQGVETESQEGNPETPEEAIAESRESGQETQSEPALQLAPAVSKSAPKPAPAPAPKPKTDSKSSDKKKPSKNSSSGSSSSSGSKSSGSSKSS